MADKLFSDGLKTRKQGKILFVGGIDTDIGKTVATGWLAAKLMRQGFSVITQKIVQTGCTGISDDILVHRRLQNLPLLPEDTDGTTCPYLFGYPCSPHLAARMAGARIDPARGRVSTLPLSTAPPPDSPNVTITSCSKARAGWPCRWTTP